MHIIILTPLSHVSVTVQEMDPYIDSARVIFIESEQQELIYMCEICIKDV